MARTATAMEGMKATATVTAAMVGATATAMEGIMVMDGTTAMQQQ